MANGKPGRPKGAISSLAELAADAENGAIKQRQADHLRSLEGLTAPGIGGKRIHLSDFLDHTYIAGRHEAIFASADKYMKEVDKNCMYVWADRKNPETFGRIRSGKYVPVTKDEIRDDTDLPIETHTMAGKEYIGVYDVILMRVSERAVKELYKHREQAAVLRTIRNAPFEDLRRMVEDLSHGTATAEVQVNEDPSQLFNK